MALRVPRNIEEFNTYITSTDTFLQAISSGIIHNWERLELSSAQATAWHDARLAWDPLFVSWSSELTRTKGITTDVHTFIENFIVASRLPLNIIASTTNAVSSDGVLFHVVLTVERAHPSHPTESIPEGCVVGIEYLGGGSLRFSFRKTGDTGTASIVEGANSVQIAAQLGGDTVPEDADDMHHEILTHAVFTQSFGTQNVGSHLYLFARFYNTKYPNLAGPWSIRYKIVIS